MDSRNRLESRRQLLKWLSASPLLAFPGLAALAADGASPAQLTPQDPRVWAPAPLQDLITNPMDAINVFDFEPVMRNNVPPAHFGYMASGIDDEVTLRANREGFLKFQLRPRRLVDVSTIDTSTEILGVKYDTPIIVAPIGGHRAYHADGELAVARAAKVGNHRMILSTQSTTSPEDVLAARGAPIWYQLYATNKWEVSQALLTRAERAGCVAVAVTVDRNGGRNQETLFRLQRTDTRDCSVCHDRSSLEANYRRRPMYEGVDLSGLTNIQSSAMTWDTIKRMRDATRMKMVLKGLLAHEDATLAVTAGVDAIIVSNHGARSEDSGRSTIDALLEILEAVKGRLPVLVDSGFRRGTDVFTALALGASAVCIGRPYLWGLAAFGEAGVEGVLRVLSRELETVMRHMGTRDVASITRDFVQST
jgi:isopentenyl diphosphate isomerase/L-lactate dehydrogenase-like FMN-dependent dehydrogenase